MKTVMPIQKLVILVLLLASSPVAYAIDCQEKSPNYIKQKEKYFDLTDAKPLTRSQRDAVKNIFNPLKSRLTGTGTLTYCKGKSEDYKVITVKEKIKMQYRIQSNGALTIDLDIENLKKKSSYSETIQAFSSGANFKLDSISDNSITMIEKLRRAYPNGFSRLIERIATITVNDGKLDLQITQYHNGYFADSVIRHLQ